MTDFDAAAGSGGEVCGALFDHVPVGVAELDPDGQWLRVNRHLGRMLGFSAGEIPPAMLDGLTHPDDRDVDSINVELLATGVVDGYRQERRLRRADGSFLWVDSSLCAIRKSDGTIGRLAAVFHDVSRYKEVERRQQTLLGELAHRGRNLFAVLQSLARHSLTGDRSPSEAYGAFQGRLKALSESLNSFMHKEFGGMRFDVLLRKELHSLGARATLGGPAVLMKPNAAQTFALVLHELATNATKYGALSTADGKVSVTWSVTGTGESARFSFDWREAAGVPATPPGRRGFGTFLTIEVAGAEFDCEPRPIYGASGFEYGFDAPLTRVGALVVESPVRRRLKNPVVCALYDCWIREQERVGGLSTFAGFDWTGFAATGAMTVGRVQPDGSVRITRVGRALVERLRRPLSEQELESESLDGLRELYRRCARQAAPCHEYLRFDFGAGDPVALERLLVPFGEAPGGPVSHLIGIAIFTGSTNVPRDEAAPTGRDVAALDHD